MFDKEHIELWSSAYDAAAVEHCFEQRCTVVSYNEETQRGRLGLRAVPSGHHLGACNWVLSEGETRIGVMGPSSLYREYRYPMKMDTTALRDCDVLIVRNVINPRSASLNPMQAAPRPR